MGRPRKEDSNNRSTEAHTNKSRPARVPMSAGGKLNVPEDLKKEGYQYYWQVDRPGVIEQMERAWWEKVTDSRGGHVTVPGGSGETLYLMHIEQKYYDEDMETQQKRNIDATAKQAQALGEEEYVPMGKTSVVEREII